MNSPAIPVRAPSRRSMGLSNPEFGMLLFIATELMFFAALISSWLVVKAGHGPMWVPPNGVRLPVAVTSFNTLLLLASGFFIWKSGRFIRSGASEEDWAAGMRWTARAALFGIVFLAIQGYEWYQLIGHGMTFLSGIFSATFFLIIGAHWLHVVAAVVSLVWVHSGLKSKKVGPDGLRAMQLYWYLVVGIWPVIYGLVYF